MKDGDRVVVVWQGNELDGKNGNLVKAHHGWLREVRGGKELLALVQLDGREKMTVVPHKHLMIC